MPPINVAVVTGGTSAEINISFQSAACVLNHLDTRLYRGFKVVIIGADWYCEVAGEKYPIDKNDFSCNIAGEQTHFDLVFAVIHGPPAEDGRLQGYFDMMGIAYANCNVLSSALTFDKQALKDYLKTDKVKLAKSLCFDSRKDSHDIARMINEGLSLPVFIKPNKNGSSYGVSRVDEVDDLLAAVELVKQYDDEIMAEEFIDGKELTCGALRKDGEIVALPVTEIIPKSKFFDYEAKYKGESEEITPARITDDIRDRVQAATRELYETLWCAGLVRPDYILSGNDLYLLEVNTTPGLTDASLVPQQARAHGWSLKQLFHYVIVECLREFGKAELLNTVEEAGIEI